MMQQRQENETAVAEPMSDAELYRWSGDEPNCPDVLVVNAGNMPLIIGAHAQVPFERGRMYPGDRRHGQYYVDLIKVPGVTGLQLLSKIPLERRVELEKIRRLRSGDEPGEWVRESWSKLPEEAQKRLVEEFGEA